MVSSGNDPEDRDRHIAENIFYVPEDIRWEKIQSEAKTPQISKTIYDVLRLIEDELHTILQN